MNCPQSSIEQLENKIINIRKYGCCAFATIWALGIEATNEESWALLLNALENKSLDKDCTVNWGAFTKFLTGKEIIPEFKAINSLEDIKDCGRCVVRYDNGNNSHWVGVEDGKVAFNSLSFSYCVNYGKPTTARIFK
ncbi:MAG: hypothetical protein MJ174_07365 [Treponema sp.]|nr:hypothetical protein [Treponema sp.]